MSPTSRFAVAAHVTLPATRCLGLLASTIELESREAGLDVVQAATSHSGHSGTYLRGSTPAGTIVAKSIPAMHQ
jgi:hypothetical protein